MEKDINLEVMRVEVTKLQLEAGDILVIRLSSHQNDDVLDEIVGILEHIMPDDVKAMILRGVEELAVISKEE